MTSLVIDIGNTNIALGVFKGEKIKQVMKFPTKKDETTSYFVSNFKKVKSKKVNRIIVSSVVPSIMKRVKKALSIVFKKEPRIVNYKDFDIKTFYRDPSQIGTDRLADVIGGYHLFKKPIIVIDFGTVTTFNCVDRDGSFSGGMIIPSIDSWLKSLYDSTEKLPLIEKLKRPPTIIGRSTEENIYAGVFYGYILLVNGLIEILKRKMPKETLIVITGGDAIRMKKFLPRHKFIPNLTLIGLNLIAQAQRHRDKEENLKKN